MQTYKEALILWKKQQAQSAAEDMDGYTYKSIFSNLQRTADISDHKSVESGVKDFESDSFGIFQALF